MLDAAKRGRKVSANSFSSRVDIRGFEDGMQQSSCAMETCTGAEPHMSSHNEVLDGEVICP